VLVPAVSVIDTVFRVVAPASIVSPPLAEPTMVALAAKLPVVHTKPVPAVPSVVVIPAALTEVRVVLVLVKDKPALPEIVSVATASATTVSVFSGWVKVVAVSVDEIARVSMLFALTIPAVNKPALVNAMVAESVVPVNAPVTVYAPVPVALEDTVNVPPEAKLLKVSTPALASPPTVTPVAQLPSLVRSIA